MTLSVSKTITEIEGGYAIVIEGVDVTTMKMCFTLNIPIGWGEHHLDGGRFVSYKDEMFDNKVKIPSSFYPQRCFDRIVFWINNNTKKAWNFTVHRAKFGEPYEFSFFFEDPCDATLFALSI